MGLQSSLSKFLPAGITLGNEIGTLNRLWINYVDPTLRLCPASVSRAPCRKWYGALGSGKLAATAVFCKKIHCMALISCSRQTHRCSTPRQLLSKGQCLHSKLQWGKPCSQVHQLSSQLSGETTLTTCKTNEF